MSPGDRPATATAVGRERTFPSESNKTRGEKSRGGPKHSVDWGGGGGYRVAWCDGVVLRHGQKSHPFSRKMQENLQC